MIKPSARKTSCQMWLDYGETVTGLWETVMRIMRNNDRITGNGDQDGEKQWPGLWETVTGLSDQLKTGFKHLHARLTKSSVVSSVSENQLDVVSKNFPIDHRCKCHCLLVMSSYFQYHRGTCPPCLWEVGMGFQSKKYFFFSIALCSQRPYMDYYNVTIIRNGSLGHPHPHPHSPWALIRKLDDDDDELMLNVLRCHLTY